MGLGSGAVRAAVGCLMAGATCAGFRSTMGAPPFAGEGCKKAFHPRNFPGRKACTCLSRYHPHWPKTAHSVTETAQQQNTIARFPSAVSGVPARVYWAATRLFKRVLRAVLRSIESAAFPASAALCKVRVGGTLPVMALRALYRPIPRFVKRGTAKKPLRFCSFAAAALFFP